MKKILILMLFAGALVSNAQVTIDNCHEKASTNHPLIKQYDLINQSTDFTIANANKAYLPQVKLNAIGGYVIKGFPSMAQPGQTTAEQKKTQLIGIAQVNQLLWDGGATHAQKEIIKAAAEIEKANTDVSIYAIRERVNQVFFGILLIDEQLKQLDIVNDNLQRNLSKIELSKENGLAYQTDVDEMKAEILLLEQRKTEFGYARRGYVHMMSLLTGEPFNESTQFEKPVLTKTDPNDKINRPELTLFEKQRKLNETELALNKVSLMPKIGFMATGLLVEPGIRFGNSEISELAIAGVSMSWNIGGFYKNENNKKLNEIKVQKINNQQEAFLFTNNIQLTQSAAEIEKQKAIISRDEEILKLRTEITKTYQERFDNGMCPMNDLLNAVSRESEARANRALHEVQLLMGLYNYKTISGN